MNILRSLTIATATTISLLLVNSAKGAPTYRYTCDWETSGAGSDQFRSVAMSSNGTIQAALASNQFYYSNDSGVTFSIRPMVAIAVGMSSDGNYITCSCAGSRFISNDSGSTWTNFTNSQPTTAVGLSASGKYQLISGMNYFMTSNDFGISWTEHASNVTDAYSWVASVTADGRGQIVGYATNSSFQSLDYGETFVQDTQNDMTPGQQINQFAHNFDLTNVDIAADGSLYQSLNLGATFRTVLNGTFSGAAQSGDGKYHLATKPNEYLISSDNGLTWTVGDGLPSITNLGIMASSLNGSSIMMIDNNDQSGLIYEGNCGWSFNPYVTATVVEQETIVIPVQAVVSVDEIIYI